MIAFASMRQMWISTWCGGLWASPQFGCAESSGMGTIINLVDSSTGQRKFAEFYCTNKMLNIGKLVFSRWRADFLLLVRLGVYRRLSPENLICLCIACNFTHRAKMQAFQMLLVHLCHRMLRLISWKVVTYSRYMLYSNRWYKKSIVLLFPECRFPER